MTFVRQVIQCLATSLLVYVTLFFLFSSLPQPFHSQGFFKNILSQPQWVTEKAKETAKTMQENHLALNFIGNIRKLSFQEAKALQNSGLMHLLAISGGQLVPLANYCAEFFGIVLYYLLRNKKNHSLIMQLIFQCKLWLSLAVSFFICYIFGCTGALVRAGVFSYFSKVSFMREQYQYIYYLENKLTSSTVMRSFILILVTFCFGNIFANFSFMLSAIGASCAELSSVLTEYFFKKSFLLKSLSMTVLTSLFTGIILSPFMSSNLADSCMANILALPVVGIFITPLSLLALFIPNSFFFFPFIVKLLDLSFVVFRHIAFTFNSPYNQINPFSKANPLFSAAGALYLNSILICLWVVLDVYRERKIFMMREKFSKL